MLESNEKLKKNLEAIELPKAVYYTIKTSDGQYGKTIACNLAKSKRSFNLCRDYLIKTLR